MNKNPIRAHRRERFLDLSRGDSGIHPGRLDLGTKPRQEVAPDPQIWVAEPMRSRVEDLRETPKAAADSEESQAA